MTAKGEKQARTLAKELKAAPIEAIYVSELERTKQTADIINQGRDLPIITDDRLNELRIGFEGQSHEEWKAAKETSERGWTFRVEGAESMADGQQRTAEFLSELARQGYRHVAIVTHGFIVMAIRAIIEGFSLEDEFAQNHDPGLKVPQDRVIELTLTRDLL